MLIAPFAHDVDNLTFLDKGTNEEDYNFITSFEKEGIYIIITKGAREYRASALVRNYERMPTPNKSEFIAEAYVNLLEDLAGRVAMRIARENPELREQYRREYLITLAED